MKAASKSWEDVAAEKVYQPLGMKHTSSRYADFVAAKNRALGHVFFDGKWVAEYSRDPDAQSPAGGVSSTVRDLAQWVRLQLGNGNDLFGEIEIVEKDGGLVLQLGPKKDASPLRHFDRDVFTYQPVGENAYGLSAVTFSVGADGKANSVNIENLNINGQGTFARTPTTN